jgi:NitT/TauT family transport system substrate-binding protein
MNRRRFLALAGSLAGIGCFGCSSRAKLGTIRISTQPYFSMSPLYLAKELGYFEKLGLQIDIVTLAESGQAIPLAAAGKLDVVFTPSSASLINAISKGSRLRIVAGRELASPKCPDINVLYGRRAVFPNGIQDLRSLKGKRIAVDLRFGMERFGLDTILKSAGMTAEELGILNMNRSGMLVALLSGRIDAIVVSDFAKRYPGVADQIVRGISLADILPNYQISFISFGSRLLDGDPVVGTRFLSAYLHAAGEYRKGKTPRFFDELAISNGMNPTKIRATCRDTFVPDGRIDLPSLDRFIQWALSQGLCQIPIQATQLVDMRFMEKLWQSGEILRS